jgi:two-component system nitrogen regulation response regulator GlnG
VRELRHAVEYAAVMARGGTLRAEHMPEPAHEERAVNDGQGSPVEEALAAAVRAWVGAHWHDDANVKLHEQLIQFVESCLLDEALARTGGNRSAAARMLGLDRATLRSKLER